MLGKSRGRCRSGSEEDGFSSLLDIIVSQQVSVAAADSIWAKLRAAGLDDPSKLSAATDAKIRACGTIEAKN